MRRYAERRCRGAVGVTWLYACMRIQRTKGQGRFRRRNYLARWCTLSTSPPALHSQVDAREARIKRMHDKFHSQLKAVSQSPKALKRRMSFARSHSGGDANTGPPKRRMSFTRGRSKSAPLEGTAMPMSPAATKKSQVAPAANEAWGLSPTVSPVNPVSPVNGESKSNERSKSLVVAHRCAPGTGSTHHWVYHETEMTCFDHIDLRDMGVHIDHDLDPATDPIVVLEKVTLSSFAAPFVSFDHLFGVTSQIALPDLDGIPPPNRPNSDTPCTGVGAR